MASTSKLLNKNDIVVAVFGATGTGKSSFVQSLATNEEIRGMVGHKLRSQTSDIKAMRILNPTTGEPIIIADTPGFDDTYRSDAEILELLADWLSQTYRKGVKLSGIVFLHRISDNRFAGTPLRNLEMFGRLCGDRALKRVALVTTMWDCVPPEVGADRQKELMEEFWEPMIRAGCLCDQLKPRSSAKGWAIINQLIGVKADDRDRTLLLQEEIVDLRKHLGDTQAGRALLNVLQTLLIKQRKVMQSIRKEILEPNNAMLVEDLRKQRLEIESKVAETVAQLSEMKVPFHKRVVGLFQFKKARSRIVEIPS